MSQVRMPCCIQECHCVSSPELFLLIIKIAQVVNNRKYNTHCSYYYNAVTLCLCALHRMWLHSNETVGMIFYTLNSTYNTLATGPDR